MTVHLVTFSDESMEYSKARCMDSALRYGCDTANGRGLSYLRHFPTFCEDWIVNRGLGWWHWKPIIIEQALHEHLTGDTVIYADAGVGFINNVSHIIDRMDQDIFLFGNNWEHAHWCKRDIVEAIMPGTPWEKFGKQVQASVIFFRVSEYSRNFVNEWLRWCLMGQIEYVTVESVDGLPMSYPKSKSYLIDDSPSRAPNHPEFQENRHDQAILTTLAYREGIKLHWWPASYNDGAFVYEKIAEYAGDNYPIMFNHHRRRNHEWEKCA